MLLVRVISYTPPTMKVRVRVRVWGLGAGDPHLWLDMSPITSPER